MGMNVLAYDVYPNDSGRTIGEYVDLDVLLKRADVVSLHCNLLGAIWHVHDTALKRLNEAWKHKPEN